MSVNPELPDELVKVIELQNIVSYEQNLNYWVRNGFKIVHASIDFHPGQFEITNYTAVLVWEKHV